MFEFSVLYCARLKIFCIVLTMLLNQIHGNADSGIVPTFSCRKRLAHNIFAVQMRKHSDATLDGNNLSYFGKISHGKIYQSKLQLKT